MDKVRKNLTLSHLDISAISWLSATSKKRQMAEGSEFRSGIRPPDSYCLRQVLRAFSLTSCLSIASSKDSPFSAPVPGVFKLDKVLLGTINLTSDVQTIAA